MKRKTYDNPHLYAGLCYVKSVQGMCGTLYNCFPLNLTLLQYVIVSYNPNGLGYEHTFLLTVLNKCLR